MPRCSAPSAGHGVSCFSRCNRSCPWPNSRRIHPRKRRLDALVARLSFHTLGGEMPPRYSPPRRGGPRHEEPLVSVDMSPVRCGEFRQHRTVRGLQLRGRCLRRRSPPCASCPAHLVPGRTTVVPALCSGNRRGRLHRSDGPVWAVRRAMTAMSCRRVPLWPSRSAAATSLASASRAGSAWSSKPSSSA